MTTRTCALLTLDDPTGYFIDDSLLDQPLAKLGWEVAHISWRANVDWNNFEIVVLRSTWDYQNAPKDFLRVLGEIEKSRAILANPLSAVKWNLTKTYLAELERAGISIVPTIWPQTVSLAALSEARFFFGGGRFIIKPTVGANADGVFIVREQFETIVETYQGRPAMLQPFLPSITETGEYSLIYFLGTYSHCVLKKPASDDFRVQEEHGGSVQALTPEKDIRALADQAIDNKLKDLLYARVDICRLPDGKPAVMEVELIEPSLFFPMVPESAQRFAKAIDTVYCKSHAPRH